MARRQSSFIKGMLISDWRNKVFAIALSSVIWFMAYNAQKTEQEVVCQVFLLPTDRVVIQATVEEGSAPGQIFDGSVTLTLSAQRGDLMQFNLSGRSIAGSFDASHASSETNLLALNRIERFEGLPEGCSIVRCDPEVIRCEIEELVDVEKEVIPIIADPEDELLTSRWSSIQPPSIWIRVPSGAVNSAEVYTKRIDVEGKPSSFTGEYELELTAEKKYADHLFFADPRKSEVTVSVMVEPSTKKDTVTIPVRYGVLPGFGIGKGAVHERGFTFVGTESALAELKSLVAAGKVIAFVGTAVFAGMASEELNVLDIKSFYFVGLPSGLVAKDVHGGVQYQHMNLDFREKTDEEDDNK